MGNITLPHKESFKIVKVGDFVHLQQLSGFTDNTSLPILKHSDDFSSSVFQQIVSAENCTSEEHFIDGANLVKLLFKKNGIEDFFEEGSSDLKSVVINRSGLMLKCYPILFDASKGPIAMAEDYSFWTIDDDIILPQYLIMELCQSYVHDQPEGIIYGVPTNDYEDFRNLLIYVPEGDSEYSLYEQQRLFNEYRAKELAKLSAALNMGVGLNGTLAGGALLRNGKYIIDEYISGGGFGKVYKAKTTKGHNVVAIKELFVKKYCSRMPYNSNITIPEMARQGFVRQMRKFQCEQSILSKLNTVTRYVPKAIGEPFMENNTIYYAMEYIYGGTLWSNCKSGTLTQNQIVNIICQAGIALHHAHDLDYLHLDVSPLNIMVDEDGNGILIDFGSNKHYSDDDGGITSVGQVAKTKSFAAPEMLQQVVGQYYMQSDVYSLAATLYTALTNDIPFCHTQDNDEDFVKHIQQKMDAVDVPEGLVNVILKSLSYSIEDRPSTVLEFLHLLPQEVIETKIQQEINLLRSVSGFNASNHCVSSSDMQDADYIPDYTSEEISD